MARKAQLERLAHPERYRFTVRIVNRCKSCGRSRAYLRKFALCRLCFRKLALKGDISGVTKSSW
ncbi:MAG: type Z 30S ribosomal protein S14 [Myxococcales bacterium]|nr:type Z 30S ribosomal protein S14 [Myxococcales bacterium]